MALPLQGQEGGPVSQAPEFRMVQETDLDDLVALETQLSPAPWSRGNFLDSLAADHFALTCRVAGDAVGYGVISQVLDEAELLILGVARQHQRQGLGAQLLEALCRRARQAGANIMHLEVRASNLPAQALYTHHGFRVVGRRKAYYPGPAGREDALLMSAVL